MNTAQLQYKQEFEQLRRFIRDRLNERMIREKKTESDLYDEMDFNKDSFISLLELKLYIQNLQISVSDDQISAFLKNLDKNNEFKSNISDFFDYIFGELSNIESISWGGGSESSIIIFKLYFRQKLFLLKFNRILIIFQ